MLSNPGREGETSNCESPWPGSLWSSSCLSLATQPQPFNLQSSNKVQCHSQASHSSFPSYSPVTFFKTPSHFLPWPSLNFSATNTVSFNPFLTQLPAQCRQLCSQCLLMLLLPHYRWLPVPTTPPFHPCQLWPLMRQNGPLLLGAAGKMGACA